MNVDSLLYLACRNCCVLRDFLQDQ